MRKLIVLFFVLVSLIAQNSVAQKNAKVKATSEVQVLQFHSEYRCFTCKKIEKLTQKTINTYFPNVPFELINVEEKKNEKLAGQFQAAGTALFLFNSKSGKKVNLTEFAFMRAGNDELFVTELRKYIEEFKKG